MKTFISEISYNQQNLQSTKITKKKEGEKKSKIILVHLKR